MPVMKATNKYYVKSMILIAGVLVVVVMGFVTAARAETYSWTDEAGNRQFTDRAELVPQQYQGKAEVSDDEISRNWEYLASENGVHYYYDTASVIYINRNRYRVMTKESYAASGREEYETQVVMDCARLLFKPVQSVRIFNNQRSTVDSRYTDNDNGYSDNKDGFKRFTHPYQVLYRIICKDQRL